MSDIEEKQNIFRKDERDKRDKTVFIALIACESPIYDKK